MAISQRFPITFHLAFPFGAYLVSDVTPVIDFDKSSREHKVQQVDKDTGKLLWQVEVLDADPEAKRSAKTVAVKIPANVQPVPPGNDGSSPFTAVEFTGLSALPYVEQVSETFSRIAWSFKAEDVIAPTRRPSPVASGDQAAEPGKPGSSKSAAA
jgi:hypothetical protein